VGEHLQAGVGRQFVIPHIALPRPAMAAGDRAQASYANGGARNRCSIIAL